MTDMMQLAKQRHDQILKDISEREADISKLKEEAERLELFVTLGKELFPPKAEAGPAPSQDLAAQPSATPIAQQEQRPETPRVMPVRQPQSA